MAAHLGSSLVLLLLSECRRALGLSPRGDDGATLVEYAIMLAAIAAVAIAAVTAMGQSVTQMFQSAVDGFN